MGFLTGRATFLRFAVAGRAPAAFGPEHIDRLSDRKAGRQRVAAADGVETGWTAGASVLDTDFTLEKNVVNDALAFALRVDTDRLPGDLMHAYYAAELAAAAKENPSGFASARQKREAKDAARERLEEEAKDGRFRRRKAIQVLWDRRSNELLFGATSLTQVDRLCGLFEQTFGARLDCVTAGGRAARIAELRQRTRALDDAGPTPFLYGCAPEVAWVADEASRDWLGNEFVLWLWYVTDARTDTFALSDGSEAVLMLARTLTLECPRGQTGTDTFRHEGPARLPEAKRAARAGKLPRRAGLTIVRRDRPFELTLHAETLGVGAAKLPPPPEDATDARARLDERVDAVRELQEVVDLLYDSFLGARLDPAAWADEVAGVKAWLGRPERAAA